MKRLAEHSQYFLRSPDFIKELIGHTNIRKNDTVYDIGAGSGAISAALSNKCKQVVAIEFEPRMADKLRENMERYDNVTVKVGDFLKMPLPAEPYKVFSNIPFHLSSEIVRKLTETEHPPKAMYLIVQKQFARKLLIEKDFFTGLIGAMIAPRFAAKIRRPLRKTDYWPHPNVDTVLLEIKPRPEPLLPFADMSAYRELVSKCFADPRAFAKTPREKAGIGLELKPSQVRTEQWVQLFKLTKR